LGKLMSIPFNFANALLASIVFRSILVVSNAAFGGNKGR